MFLGIVLSFLLINIEALVLPNNLLINNEYNITWTPSQFTEPNVSLTLMYSLQTNLPAVYSNGTNILDISITNNGNSHEIYKFSKGSGVPESWNFEDTLIFETQSLEPYGGYEMFILPFEIPVIIFYSF